MSCSTCYPPGNPFFVKYPNGCGCSGQKCPISSDSLYYAGPNLPWTGINNLDTITVSLQKIDEKINPTSILTQILDVLATNPTLKAQLCAALSDC